MFILIESKNKKAEIQNIEFEKDKITFFLSDFFYITFEKEEEREKFISEMLKNFKESYNDGKSYVEVCDSLINSSMEWNNFVLQDTNKLVVKSYSFLNFKDHLEIYFASEKGYLKLVLYKKLITKIKELKII